MIKIEETPNLILLKKPVDSASYLIGIVFIIMSGVFIFFYKGALFPRLIVSSFTLFGLMMIFLSESVDLKIDKNKNLLSFRFASIIRKRYREINFSEIKEVAVEEHYDSASTEHTPRHSLQYNLVFYTKEGEGILVYDFASSYGLDYLRNSSTSGRSKAVEIGNKVAALMGVPFVELEPVGLERVAQTIKDMRPMK